MPPVEVFRLHTTLGRDYREGAQEYQDIFLDEFVTRVFGEKSGKILARLQDHPIVEGLTLFWRIIAGSCYPLVRLIHQHSDSARGLKA